MLSCAPCGRSVLDLSVTSLLSTIQGQPTAVATLERALESGRIHHAYLFDGPSGVGKERAAFGLAQGLVCEERKGPKACGACSACVRAVPKKGERVPTHPDVIVIERGLYEPAQIGRRTPETQDISIDQVRTLILARAAYRPHEGKAKVFIVRRAEELSVSAANALLKTLEEPGQDTYFILLTSQAASLLPTIRSRTLRLRFGALPDAVLQALLVETGIERGAAAEAARLAHGRLDAALALAGPEGATEMRAFVEQALQALEAKHALSLMTLAEQAKGYKDRLARGLIDLSEEYARLVRARGREGEAPVEDLLARFFLVAGALEQFEFNANPQLLMESLLLRMRAV